MTQNPTAVDVDGVRSRLAALAELPEEQRRLEVGNTPAGERACVVCRRPLAGQVAYLPSRHSSKDAACGECVTASRYLTYTEHQWTERPVLSRAMWQERYYGSAELPRSVTCEVCGTAFARLGYRHTNQRTCSYDCEAERERRRRRVPKVERPCIVCGELFTPKRRDARTHSASCRKALSRMDAITRAAAEKRDEEWRASQDPDGTEVEEESRDDRSPGERAAASVRKALMWVRYALDELDDAAAALREDPEAEVPGVPPDARAALLAWERPRPGVVAGRLLGLDTSHVDAERARSSENRDEVTA